MPRAAAGSKQVVGFIVGNTDEERGKFVKTAEEASKWLTDEGAEFEYGALSDGWACYMVTKNGDLRCADVERSGVNVTLGYGYSMAADK